MDTNRIKINVGLIAQFCFSLSLFSFSCTPDAPIDQPGANDKFKLFNKTGEIRPFSQAGNKIFLYITGTEYILSSSVVLLHPGIYNFIFSTGLRLRNAELINPPSDYAKIIAGVGPTYFMVNHGIDINQNLLTNNTTTTFDLPDSIDWAKPVFSFEVIK